jgi:hypothetical protein
VQLDAVIEDENAIPADPLAIELSVTLTMSEPPALSLTLIVVPTT